MKFEPIKIEYRPIVFKLSTHSFRYFTRLIYISFTVESAWGLFIQQKMKIRSRTAEFKLLAFSVVTASM